MNLPQIFERLFRTTTPRTSHVGQGPYANEETWNRFFAKYRHSCMDFVRLKYPASYGNKSQ